MPGPKNKNKKTIRRPCNPSVILFMYIMNIVTTLHLISNVGVKRTALLLHIWGIVVSSFVCGSPHSHQTSEGYLILNHDYFLPQPLQSFCHLTLLSFELLTASSKP